MNNQMRSPSLCRDVLNHEHYLASTRLRDEADVLTITFVSTAESNLVLVEVNCLQNRALCYFFWRSQSHDDVLIEEHLLDSASRFSIAPSFASTRLFFEISWPPD
jgi:hypothetical protein